MYRRIVSTHLPPIQSLSPRVQLASGGSGQFDAEEGVGDGEEREGGVLRQDRWGRVSSPHIYGLPCFLLMPGRQVEDDDSMLHEGLEGEKIGKEVS